MRLFHRDLGGAGKPPLLILHGLLGSSRNWQTAGRDLAERYHVAAVDLRNHGASPHSGEMTWKAMFDDVVAWLDAQGWERPEVLGHSLGGKVAMLLACRRPERVARLIAVDIAPKAYFWPERRGELGALLEIDLERLASRAEAARQLELKIPDWALRQFLLTNLDRGEDGRWRWQANLPAILGSLGELEGNPLGAEDRFAGPARFVVGGESRYVKPEDRSAIAAHFPSAETTVLAGSGHNPHLDDRAGLVRAIFD